MRPTALIFVFLVVLGGCSGGPADGGNVADSGPAPQDSPAPRVSVYHAAVNHADRSERDIARDAGRKPGEVLGFFGIKPGMTVLDMFSGGGYYTELASRVVGESGRVVSHTNAAYAQFVGDEATNRYADNRLPNVQILMAENNELDLPAGEFDAVLMILAFHDIFYVDSKNGWPKIDGPMLLAELYQSMKPGAVLGVVDHYAEAGSPRETGGTLHRIDPEIVLADLGKAGFVFDGKSEILRNMDDDYGKNMADPSVRGRTDRFVFRFRKPD
ncbi:MAG: methyltransferase domain-containing protein [Gammaproteobacteria bacterium]|nr:methyltransferase domain-containing protein [Gammaproteobacteria bacterium]